MAIITIREVGQQDNHFQAKVNFGGAAEYPVTVANPFGAKEEHLLEWYFEEWISFPYLKAWREYPHHTARLVVG